jgi:hypothetical protein
VCVHAVILTVEHKRDRLAYGRRKIRVAEEARPANPHLWVRDRTIGPVTVLIGHDCASWLPQELREYTLRLGHTRSTQMGGARLVKMSAVGGKLRRYEAP